MRTSFLKFTNKIWFSQGLVCLLLAGTLFLVAQIAVKTILLVSISIANAIIVHSITRPIRQIVNAIRPFNEGKEEVLPRLNVGQQEGEFSKLASILNELTDRIQGQIEKLTRQREE